MAILIDIRLPDHIVYFFILQLLPKIVIMYLSSAAEISPFPLMSNTLKASISSSSMSMSFIFLDRAENIWPSVIEILGNWWCRYRLLRPLWSLPLAWLWWGFGQGIAQRCRVLEREWVPYWWWSRRRSCRKVRRPIWILRFVPRSFGQPFLNQMIFKLQLIGNNC